MSEIRPRYYNPEEEKVVDNTLDGYVAAWNNRSPEEIASYFHPEAEFVTVWGMKACGPEQIMTLSEAMLKILPSNFFLHLRSTCIHFVAGYRVAAAELSWEILQADKIDPGKQIDLSTFPYQEGTALLVMSRERKKPPLDGRFWGIDVIYHPKFVSEPLWNPLGSDGSFLTPS